ncbi:MAG: potassium channel family protein [Albidovulum sp.]|nr:potassium channel family protein [Albidovulum sp.]
MKFHVDPNRTWFLALYAAICVSAISLSALLHLAPGIWIWLIALFLQFLLLYTTGLCLMPATRDSAAVFTRPSAILIVLASGAINISCFALIHLETGLRDATLSSDTDSFRDGLYFSVVTFTTLGYGDLQPFPEGRLAAAFQAFSGYVYLGLGIGLAVNGFRITSRDDGGQNTSR